MKSLIKPVSCLMLPGIFCVSVAFAQSQGAGNGGNAIVCFDDPKIADELVVPQNVVVNTIPDRYLDHIVSIETLDLADAKKPIGLASTSPEIKQLNPGETPEQFVKRVLSAYDAVVSTDDWFTRSTFSQLIERGKKALKAIQISPNEGVIPANDIHPLTKAKNGCVYSTIAVQRSTGNGQRELVIDGRLYGDKNRNSDLSRAALILHEYVLAADLTLNPNSLSANSTEGVREFVSAILRRDTRLSDLVEIVNRRNLFHRYSNYGDLYFDRGYFTFLEEAVKGFKTEYENSLAQAFKETESQFESIAGKTYGKLPRWYKSRVSLHRQGAPFPKCILVSRHEFLGGQGAQISVKKCVRNDEILDQLNNMAGDFFESHVLSRLTQIWVLTESQRLTTLAKAFEKEEQSNFDIEATAWNKLKTSLTDYAKEGYARYVRNEDGVHVNIGKDHYNFNDERSVVIISIDANLFTPH